MHPILAEIENTILGAKDLNLYRHIGAANFSGRIYGDDALRRMWSMSPASQIYYSVLNPIFTALQADLEKKNLSYPITLYRDGVIDFIQYMIDNSKPESSSYIVDERLAPYLSDAWWESGLFYRLYYAPSQQYQLPIKRTRLVVASIANGSFVSVETFEQALHAAKEFASKHKLDIQVHLPVRENLFFDNNYRNQSALFSAADSVYRILGTDTAFLSDKKVTMDSDYRNAYYLIPSDGALCLSDNTLEHQFLTKGAAPMVPKLEVKVSDFKVPLSTNHGVVISHKTRPDNCGELFNNLVKEAVFLKENSSLDISKHQFPHFAKQLTYGDFFHYVKALRV